MITQVSVFLENEPGKLSVPCLALARAGIDIMALSLADTHRFGVLRLVVSDVDGAIEVLNAAGCVVESDDVIAVAVEGGPGGFAEILKIVEAEQINIEYVYPLTRPAGKSPVMVCRFHDPAAATAALRAADVTLIDDLAAIDAVP